jgi:hypothetical protein
MLLEEELRAKAVMQKKRSSQPSRREEESRICLRSEDLKHKMRTCDGVA